MLRVLTCVVALLGSIWASASPAVAASEVGRHTASVTAGSNQITADQRVKFSSYTVGTTLNITLNYSGTCNLVFSGLLLRSPKPFTPKVAVTGALSNVTGTPASGAASTTGSVSFDLVFNSLQHMTTSDFGKAHLSLVLGADEDCNPGTGDTDGVDGSVTIPVVIAVSNPVSSGGGGGGGGDRQPGYVTLGTDPNTHLPIYECDTVNGPPPGTNYYLAGLSGNKGQPPSRGVGLPIYAPNGASQTAVTAAINLTGGTPAH